MFQKAVKSSSKLRLAIAGPSGSGKTWTALAIATAMAPGKVAVVDTEYGSASKYADDFDFAVAEMHAPYTMEKYLKAIKMAAQNGFEVVILDSISHAWNGQGGILEVVDNAAKKMGGNSYYAWREGTPLHQSLVDGMLSAPLHVIATMRTKEEYAETLENGKKTYRKVGTAPIQRDGISYEMDIVFELNLDHEAVVTKSRCSAIADKVIKQPGADVAQILTTWLQGAPVTVQAEATQENAQPEPAPTNGVHPEADFGMDHPFDDVPESTKQAELPGTVRKQLHAVGTQLYGKEWDNKRPALVSAISKKRTESSKELTLEEAQKLIDGMRQKLEAEPVAA